MEGTSWLSSSLQAFSSPLFQELARFPYAVWLAHPIQEICLYTIFAYQGGETWYQMLVMPALFQALSRLFFCHHPALLRKMGLGAVREATGGREGRSRHNVGRSGQASSWSYQSWAVFNLWMKIPVMDLYLTVLDQDSRLKGIRLNLNSEKWLLLISVHTLVYRDENTPIHTHAHTSYILMFL